MLDPSGDPLRAKSHPFKTTLYLFIPTMPYHRSFNVTCPYILSYHLCNGYTARERNKVLSTEMDVLRSSARKSRMERIKNEHTKEIIEVEGKPDIIERKRLQ